MIDHTKGSGKSRKVLEICPTEIFLIWCSKEKRFFLPISVLYDNLWRKYSDENEYCSKANYFIRLTSDSDKNRELLSVF
jgi:hypothetical protein